eukprot:scaffold498168_cov36-Prasinocladus_malaysianus.AAC.1
MKTPRRRPVTKTIRQKMMGAKQKGQLGRPVDGVDAVEDGAEELPTLQIEVTLAPADEAEAPAPAEDEGEVDGGDYAYEEEGVPEDYEEPAEGE